MAILNFKYGAGTPSAYEQGTVYVSTDNKKVYVGNPGGTGGFCIGDFIEVSVSASKGQQAALKALKGPQQNVLYLTYNTTDGYDLWKYNGTDFINLTKTGEILSLISQLTDVVDGINSTVGNINTSLGSYLTKTEAENTYEKKGTAAGLLEDFGNARIQPIEENLEQLEQDFEDYQSEASNNLANTLKDYAKTTEVTTAINTAKNAILGEENSTKTVKGAYEAAAAAQETADTGVANAATAQARADKGVNDAAAAKSAADKAQETADAAQADAATADGKAVAAQQSANQALEKLADVGTTVGASITAAKTEILGTGYNGTVKEAANAAATAQSAAEAAQEDATQALEDAEAAQGAADAAQADATNALTALNEITNVTEAINDAKAAILGGSNSTLKAAESSISTLDSKVDDLIANIGSLSNIMNFVGVTTSALTDGATTKPIVVGGSNHTQEIGDVVIYNATEFVWNGTKWEKIGNTSAETEALATLGGRVDGLEERVEGLEDMTASTTTLISTVSQNTTDISNNADAIEDLQGQLTWGTFTSLS